MFAEMVQWMHERLQDVPIDPDIIHGGLQRSSRYIAYMIDKARVAKVILCINVRFEAGQVPDSQFVWTQQRTCNVGMTPDQGTTHRQLVALRCTSDHLVYTEVGCNRLDMFSHINH